MIPTIYLCAFLALMCLSVRGQINGPDGYDPFLNTQDNWHVLQTIGNKDAYEITASNYQGSKASTATCMNVVSMSEGLGYEQSSLFTGERLFDAAHRDQRRDMITANDELH